MRKKNSQISSLERQLDDKVCEVTEQVSQVTELEEEVAVKTVQLNKLRAELEEKTRELVSGQSTVDRVKAVHAEQCTELEKQIELVSSSNVMLIYIAGDRLGKRSVRLEAM